MHEISPVLAGTFDAADYAPAVTNINRPAPDDAAVADSSAVSATPSASSTSGVDDSRRYTKWDHSASNVDASGDFTFDDFLDLVNPLEHIPVVSSIYRGITNENINPVSRVAGDILYGGFFGIASAVMGGLSAAVDSMTVAATGHDMSGYVLASIFGEDDDKKDVQLADNPTPQKPDTPAATDPTVTATLASLTAPSAQSQPVTTAELTTPAADATVAPVSGMPLMQAKAFPLDPKKLPYGGVIAPPNMEAQNAAIALSESSHSMRLGNMLYTSPLMNGPHPLPVATTPAPVKKDDTQANAAPVTNTATSDQVAAVDADAPKTGPQKNPIPQNLIDDMVMMQALKQYKGVAAGPSTTGSRLDMTN